METPEVTHQWVVTYDGKNPAETAWAPCFASSYDEARAEWLAWALENGLPTTGVTFWYQLTAVARSDWVEVGEDTDYRKVIGVIWNEFRDHPQEPTVYGSHPKPQ